MLFAATSTETVGSVNGNNQNIPSREFPAHAAHILLIALSSCRSILSVISRCFFLPLTSFLYPVVSYLLSPLIVFATTIVNLAFIAPLSAIRHVLNSLYPIYVFCAVACITGILLGLGGRGFSAFLTSISAKPEQDGGVPIVRGGERWNKRRRRRAREQDT